MDDGSAGGDGLDLVEDTREDLVGHRDSPAGLLGELERLGSHRGHAIAHMADLVVEAHLVPRRRVGPALPTRGVLHPRGVEGVEHGVDPRQRSGLGVVDGQDAGVGVRAAQHLGVEHPARLHVVDERRVALHQLDGVDLVDGPADHVGRRDVRGRDEAGPGRRSIGPGPRLAVGEGFDDHRRHRLGLAPPAAVPRRAAPRPPPSGSRSPGRGCRRGRRGSPPPSDRAPAPGAPGSPAPWHPPSSPTAVRRTRRTRPGSGAARRWRRRGTPPSSPGVRPPAPRAARRPPAAVRRRARQPPPSPPSRSRTGR